MPGMGPEASQAEDLRLIARANAGEAGALEELYQRHRDFVYALAWRFTGNQQDSLDVLQEAFAYFFRKFPGFELTASLKSFFYPTVKHLALAQRRKNRRYSPVPEDWADYLPAPVVRDPEDSRGALAEALAGIPAEARDLLLLRYVDGLSLKEIAQVTGEPLGTIKSRLHRTLQGLRENPRMRKYFLE